MKQTDISLLITAHLNYHGHGKGRAYTAYLNYMKVRGGIAELRKVAKEGDRVSIEVYTARGWYWRDRVEFTIKSNDTLLAEEKIYKAKRKESPKRQTRDSQRQKVYNWERIAVGKHDRLSYDEILSLVDEIHGEYGVKSPKVTVTRQKKVKSAYSPMFHEIKLAEGWGQRKDVVIHEAAHSLIHLFKWNVAGHGKEYVKLVAELYEKYLGVSSRDTLGQADRFKLKVDYNFKVNCGK